MRKSIKYLLIVVYLLFVFVSCEKDEPVYNTQTDFLEYTLIEKESQVEINSDEKTILINFPEDVINADELIAEFSISEGASVFVGNVMQFSGITANNFEMPFTYEVTAEDGNTISNWHLTSTNNDYTISLGLGGFQKITLSNNRDYDWYFDQANTGTFSDVNCGPTSTTMAAKWSDPDFSFSPEHARKTYRPEGGWWYTDDIDNYLTDLEIPHEFISLSNNATGTQQKIISQLDVGNIVILCLDMYYISNETNKKWHVDKFYKTYSKDWGHFIVVKGYKQVDGSVFFEVYDPYCYRQTYSDGSFKGKNRFYRGSDIYKATSIWWNYAIVVSEKGSGLPVQNLLKKSEIPHMWGK